MAVVRVKQNVFAESRAGFIATLGDPLGRSGSFEVGADFTYQTSHFHGDKNFSAGVWGLVTGRERPRRLRRPDGVRAQGRLPERPVGLRLQLPPHRRRLRPVAGLRSPARHQQLPAGLHLRAAAEGDLHPPDVPRVLPEPHHRPRRALGELPGLHGPGQLAARERRPLRAQRRARRRAAGGALRDRGGRRDPAGRLRLACATGSRSETAAKRKLSGQATWWFGGFYSGTLDQIELEAAWTPSPLVTFLVERRARHRPPGAGRLRPDARRAPRCA